MVADIQSALAAAERIFFVLDQEDETKDIENAKTEGITKGHVVFDHVTFGYTKNKMILKDVSFEAKVGETVAIVGETGAGKTTLVNLLMRFYDINSGKILVDESPIEEYQRDYYRRILNGITRYLIFKGTVADNIRYGNGDVTMDEIMKLLRKHESITTFSHLPDDNTVLSGDGVNISKGQKQLLIIARAMLSKSQF